MNETNVNMSKKEIDLKELLTSVKIKNWYIYIAIGFYFLCVGIAFMSVVFFVFMGKIGFNWMKAQNKKIDEEIKRSKKNDKGKKL